MAEVTHTPKTFGDRRLGRDLRECSPYLAEAVEAARSHEEVDEIRRKTSALLDGLPSRSVPPSLIIGQGRSSFDSSRAMTTGPAVGELLDAYVLEQHRRGLSPLYVKDGRYVFDAFGRWLAPRTLLEAERRDVEGWIDSLDVEVGARRNYIGHLHGFYTFAADVTGETAVPTARVRRPRQPRYLPRPIRDEALRRALESALTPEMRCWVLLAAYEGLRCKEIAGLDAEDVDDGDLRVTQGKGGKPRLVPLHPEVARALEDLPMTLSGPLFRMADGRRVPPYVVSQRINAHLRRLGIASTAHSLRHWFGTRIYRSTSDLRVTQELMGHSSPSTTAGYAAWDTRKASAVLTLSVEAGP